MNNLRTNMAALVGIGALAISGMATADTYVESYTCKTEKGKTVKDVQAANAKWLSWVTDKSGVEVSSSIGTAVVGNSQIFLFVDSYPSLTAWAKVQETLDAEGGEEMQMLFDGISECSENVLWKMEPTEKA
ncbi:MAG: hypothetical protein AAF358_23340 [Pseudomonadota bacterium]